MPSRSISAIAVRSQKRPLQNWAPCRSGADSHSISIFKTDSDSKIMGNNLAHSDSQAALAQILRATDLPPA